MKTPRWNLSASEGFLHFEANMTTRESLDVVVIQYLEDTAYHDSKECEFCEHLDLLIDDPINGRPITSVPEQLFAAAWLHESHTLFPYCLHPQHPIGNYFTDFMVSGLEHFINDCFFDVHQLESIRSLLPKYAIEIDGFAWHDRTPEQAEKERKRARFIQDQGYTVIRFAAREVLCDPSPCVVEVSNKLVRNIQSVYRKIIISV